MKRPPAERKKNPQAEKWQEREINAIKTAGGDALVLCPYCPVKVCRFYGDIT